MKFGKQWMIAEEEVLRLQRMTWCVHPSLPSGIWSQPASRSTGLARRAPNRWQVCKASRCKPSPGEERPGGPSCSTIWRSTTFANAVKLVGTGRNASTFGPGVPATCLAGRAVDRPATRVCASSIGWLRPICLSLPGNVDRHKTTSKKMMVILGHVWSWGRVCGHWPGIA